MSSNNTQASRAMWRRWPRYYLALTVMAKEMQASIGFFEAYRRNKEKQEK